MSYYWFNRNELLENHIKSHKKGGKEQAARYYKENKEAIKKKTREKYTNLSEEEKDKKNRYHKLKRQYKG